MAHIDLVPMIRAAEMLGVALQTLYGWHREGRITLLKIGGKTFVSAGDINSAAQPFSEENKAHGGRKKTNQQTV